MPVAVAGGKCPAGAIVELKSRLKGELQSLRFEATNPPNSSPGGGRYEGWGIAHTCTRVLWKRPKLT